MQVNVMTIPEILKVYKISKTRLANELGIGRATLLNCLSDTEAHRHCIINGCFMATRYYNKKFSIINFDRLEKNINEIPTTNSWDYIKDTVQKRHVCRFPGCDNVFYGNQSRVLCHDCWTDDKKRYQYFE
jgi:hypothetical protein